MSSIREENLGEQLLRISAERGSQDPIFEKMSGKRLPSGVLSPGIIELPGGEVEYCYRVTGLVTLAASAGVPVTQGEKMVHTITKGELTGTRIMEILGQITDAMQELREYLIDPEYLSLSVDEIFIAPEDGSVKLIYRPEKEDSLLPEVRTLMNFFLQQLIHDNSADMQRIYLLYSELQKDNRSIIEAVEEIRTRNVTVIREQAGRNQREAGYETHMLDSASYRIPEGEAERNGMYQADHSQYQNLPEGALGNGDRGHAASGYAGTDPYGRTGQMRRYEEPDRTYGSGSSVRKHGAEFPERKSRTDTRSDKKRDEKEGSAHEKGLFGFRKKNRDEKKRGKERKRGEQNAGRQMFQAGNGEETVCLSDLPGGANRTGTPSVKLNPSDPSGIPMFIETFPAIIGKDRELHYRIGEPTVSRRHARIEIRGCAMYVIDLGSTNGTYVNGVRVRAETILRQGDLIRFADMEYSIDFRFL